MTRLRLAGALLAACLLVAQLAAQAAGPQGAPPAAAGNPTAAGNPGAGAQSAAGSPSQGAGEDWAAQAAQWEERAKAGAADSAEQGRLCYNAGSAWLMAARQGGDGVDLDKAMALLERAGALAPALRDQAGRNWELARQLQRQKSQSPQSGAGDQRAQQKPGKPEPQPGQASSGAGGQQNQSGQNQAGQSGPNNGRQSPAQAGQNGAGQGGGAGQNGAGKPGQPDPGIAGLQDRQAQRQQADRQSGREGQPDAGAAAAQDQLAAAAQAAAKQAPRPEAKQALEQAAQSMRQAAADLRAGKRGRADREQSGALDALAEAQAAASGAEDPRLRKLSQDERRYRQQRALLAPRPVEPVEKDW